MAKSTIEAMEKVMTKLLSPIENKITNILDRMKKLEGKLCELESKSSKMCQSCNGDVQKAASDSQPNASIASKIQKNNPLSAVNRSSASMTQETRRGSLPASAGRATQTVTSPPSTQRTRPCNAERAPASGATAAATAPNTNDDERRNRDQQNGVEIGDDWTEVKSSKKRSMRRPRKAITGTGPVDSVLQTTERVKKIHACYFKSETTAEDIQSYMARLSNSNESMFTVDKLELKHQHYASFAISIPVSKFDLFMTPGSWPPGTGISEWFRRSGGRGNRSSSACSTRRAPADPATNTAAARDAATPQLHTDRTDGSSKWDNYHCSSEH